MFFVLDWLCQSLSSYRYRLILLGQYHAIRNQLGFLFIPVCSLNVVFCTASKLMPVRQTTTLSAGLLLIILICTVQSSFRPKCGCFIKFSSAWRFRLSVSLLIFELTLKLQWYVPFCCQIVAIRQIFSELISLSV